MQGSHQPIQRRAITFNQTFQSSLKHQTNQRFTVEKVLIQGIKQNDVSKIIYTGQDAKGDQNDQIYDEKKEASSTAIDIKKFYNQQKAKSVKIQNIIDKISFNIQVLKKEESQLKQLHKNQKQSLNQVQQQLKQMNSVLQSTLYCRDIYLNMKQNTKHDIIVLKKRHFDIQILVNKDKNKLKSIQSQAFTKRKLGQSCQKMVETVERTVIFKHRQRQEKIQSFYNVLNKKHENNRRISQRQQQIKDIQLAASTDKSPQQRQWIKIYKVNNFLKKMLKAKMQRLMNQYEIIQKAFQKIKIQTSVCYGEDFVFRFLNREKRYGELLESISEKELKLQKIKVQKISLEEQFKKLQIISDQINEVNKRSNIIPIQSQSIIDKLNNKLLTIERIKQTTYHSLIKNVANLNGLSKRESIYQKYPKSQIKKLFKDYLSQINQFLLAIEKQPQSRKKVQESYNKYTLKEKTMTQDMLQKNMRIKTLQTNDGDGVYEQLQDKDMDYDNISQIDYLNHYRRAIKKNQLMNRKFRIKTIMK